MLTLVKNGMSIWRENSNVVKISPSNLTFSKIPPLSEAEAVEFEVVDDFPLIPLAIRHDWSLTPKYWPQLLGLSSSLVLQIPCWYFDQC